MTLREPRAETKSQVPALPGEARSYGQWQRQFFLPRMVGLAGFTWKTLREYGHGYFSRQRNGSPEQSLPDCGNTQAAGLRFAIARAHGICAHRSQRRG